MIQVDGVGKSYGGRLLLDNLSFVINRGERCALVGPNGSGKSTLFRLICQQETSDSGSISLPKHYHLGYLQQHIQFTEDSLLEEAVLSLPLDLGTRNPHIPHPDGPLILWNHRWEHDKNPEAFASALEALAARGARFRLALAGQSFKTIPPAFERIKHSLAKQLVVFGGLSKTDYLDLLTRADIVVSTALHEFFGISMIEATHGGAYPLVPKRLSYPELFPEHYHYDDDALVDRLYSLCTRPEQLAAPREDFTSRFCLKRQLPAYNTLFQHLIDQAKSGKSSPITGKRPA